MMKPPSSKLSKLTFHCVSLIMMISSMAPLGVSAKNFPCQGINQNCKSDFEPWSGLWGVPYDSGCKIWFDKDENNNDVTKYIEGCKKTFWSSYPAYEGGARTYQKVIDEACNATCNQMQQDGWCDGSPC